VPIVEMVENGVDLSTFQRRDREPSGPARFAFVGRLVDWKRVDLLLDAMLQVPAGYLLEVIGAGPLSGELQRQAERLGLGDRVTFHGLLSQSSTAAVLGSCDGLVLPSIYECGGAVVLEAMAVGLPVVAADWGGPADYIQHDVTGMLVSPTNPEELTAGLAAGMTRLGEDRALGQKMGGAGRLRVEAEFDWVRKVDAMCEVYLNATEKKIQGINALETAQ
jgi:glycosyltransferase involved in cell wall biosynthesis